MNHNIWLIGAGPMGHAYGKVLKGLKQDFLLIGRGMENLEKLKNEFQCQVIGGGLENALKSEISKPDYAILATRPDQLASHTLSLIKAGVKNILVEKPGALHLVDMQNVVREARTVDSRVWIAYNRRFYASVFEAQRIMEDDGGISSMHFEFTEWSHLIGPLSKPAIVKEKWFIANSTHVVDLAFFLGGLPTEIQSYCSGQLDWHPSASAFSGAGFTDKGAVFSYHANWSAPGRWGVEILTQKHRLYLKPMEELKIQEIGSIKLNDVALENDADHSYKPGIFKQVQAFLGDDCSRLLSAEEQLGLMDIYQKMAGYPSDLS